ncbi:hypothetical protein BGZ72_004930 [Mortierella alpina]|nr:hypothetical protein BGZ72_004930 [Mortierella alpina]
MSTHHAQGSVNTTFLQQATASKSAVAAERSEDVNRRDDYGMTALHRAVASKDLERVKSLLEHPKIDVNEKDIESGWTALHWALYLGCLRIAILLIQHKGINLNIEDKDRNSALDLCMATLPVSLKIRPCPGDALYTWGSNSNFTLGHSDADDRKLPELVRFPYQTSTITFPRAKSAKPTLYQLSMSKFHTAIATSEPGLTARLWGFGTNGRLGSDRKMQLRPAPVSGIPGNIIVTALGRDHTVLITAKGEVYTLGSNKYGQLGYALEAPKNGQDAIQYSPKKVLLNIAKIKIIGAAASKWHTVVHSETELFTFGFNYGQLGYERKDDIQLGPRKVASMPPGSIEQVAASDAATVCLMSSHDVFVFHKYAYHRVNFSLWPYPDWFGTLNLPSVLSHNRPRRISCSDSNFGAMTADGDIHVWSYPEVESDITLGSLPANHSATFSSAASFEKPRRVWTFRGERTLAIDFALGHNGSLIVLTTAGHVYIGSNKGNSIGRNVKWQRIPHLDRIVQVYGNPSGAWAAMRSESTLHRVLVRPGSLGSDFEESLSQFHLYQNNEKNHGGRNEAATDEGDDDDEGGEEDSQPLLDPWRINSQGWQDIERSWDHDLIPLLDLTTTQEATSHNSVSGSHLFDVEIQAGKRTIGAHRIVLAARSCIFHQAFVESPRLRLTAGSLVTVEPSSGRKGLGTRILHTVSLKVEFTTAVLLQQFLYSDRFDPFWDALDLPESHKQYARKVRQELYHLSLELALPTLQAALQYSFTHICSASLSKSMDQIIQNPSRFDSLMDVRLLLNDGKWLDGHQVILGHRSPFFNAMFVRTDEWIRARQLSRALPDATKDERRSILEINMMHMDQESVALVLKHIYTDCGPEMFNDIEKDEMDDLIHVVVSVLQISDEWLMDRLKEICESVLSEQVRAKTVVYFLEISIMYAAESLKTTCVDYICHNIETALDQRWLDDAEDDVLVLMENALKSKQDAFMPVVRSGQHLPDEADVAEMRELIKIDGYRYFKPLEAFKSNVPKTTHGRMTMDQGVENGHGARQSASLADTLGSPTSVPSTPTPAKPGWPLLDGLSQSTAIVTDHVTSTHITERPPSASARASTSGVSGWPSLSESPSTDVKEAAVTPRRKASWGQLPKLDAGQTLQDSGDDGAVDWTASKLSLREILEQEQRQGNSAQKATSTVITGTPLTKASKLSQKERRKLLQQQQQNLSIQDVAHSSPPATALQAWAKVPSASAMDLSESVSVELSGPLPRTNSTPGAASSSTPSLLEIQQGELSLFRAQPKDVPRVAIATSKPVKETMRVSGTEKMSSEAPWRLDAIPEPLRAVTRHQSQMYPKLESSSSSSGGGAAHGLGPRGGATSTASPSSGPTRPTITTGSPTNEVLRQQDVQGSGGSPSAVTPTATALSTSGTLPILVPGSASKSPSTAVSSSLSKFAIIQNQQLRDRNLLLRARHHKKSLYQIQIEEQALNQIRMINLDRVQAKATEGTGEWFTCDIAYR